MGGSLAWTVAVAPSVRMAEESRRVKMVCGSEPARPEVSAAAAVARISGVLRVVLAAVAALCLFPPPALAQAANRSSAQSPYYGSVTTAPAGRETLDLSLAGAIDRAIQSNLGLVEARDQEEAVQSARMVSLQALLPGLTAQADAGEHQINLAEFGFTPKVIGFFAPLFPGENFSHVSTVVHVTVVDAMVNYSQSLLSLPDIERYRAAKEDVRAAYYNRQSARGLTVLTVGTDYLQTLALAAQVDSARALLRADQVLLDHTVEEHREGAAANLDELRARVQMQTQQQSLLQAQEDLAKAKIALNREIGLPAEQQIRLTDTAPYSELSPMSIEEAREVAYRSRQDYQGLQAQIRAAEMESKAARWERLPSLQFSGNYGFTGVGGGVYHGTFAAVGTLSVPIFEEGKLRGDREAADSRLNSLRQQFASLRQQIDEQLRESMLDLNSDAELVRVAQSNVSLARTELEQTMARFQAGVDDNLPVVQAQATLARAESELIDSTRQHNQAKLRLARSLGIVDTQYKTYIAANPSSR